jgi:hypothetical protein
MPVPPAPAPAAADDAPTPWQITLAAEFSACADAVTSHISSGDVTGTALDDLVSQRAAYQSAASDLRTDAVDAMLTYTPEVTQLLAKATTDAKNAVADIKELAAAVGLATALLNLATAVGTAFATGNPGNLLSAAQGVIAAARNVSAGAG